MNLGATVKYVVTDFDDFSEVTTPDGTDGTILEHTRGQTNGVTMHSRNSYIAHETGFRMLFLVLGRPHHV